MIRVEIDSIRVSLMSQDRVVILKEVDSDRYLPIWIGPFEAEAIRVELQGVPVQRPLTHDLLKTVISELNGEVEQIIVSDLRNDVFYATLRIKTDGRTIDIDSRPSDAIALGVRLRVPLYVDESVMDKAAIEPEEEVGSDADLSDRAPSETGADDENLDVFSDFLNTLDLDDLDES